jgi:hypothetical protein
MCRNKDSLRVPGLLLAPTYMLPFRDVPTVDGDKLCERYEDNGEVRTDHSGRLCGRSDLGMRFDGGIMAKHPELQVHPMIEHSPLNTRDALYGGRTAAIRLHYKVRDGETIRYVDVMSLYPFVCKYHKFSIGHPIIHVGDVCKDIDVML